MASTPSARPAILLVEDSLTQAVHFRFVLEGDGFVVTHARNGVEALARLQQSRPLAIISDVNMPEMDGFELCRRVRAGATMRDLPVILLTSLADPQDVLEALASGADYFFTKPLDRKILVPRLRELQRAAGHVVRGGESAPLVFPSSHGPREVTASRTQMLNLLISTYESAVSQNHQLRHTEGQLRLLNEKLEERVRERTIELERTNAYLQKEIEFRRDAEARLREQAELLNKASEAIITMGLDLRIHFWNHGAECLLGRTQTEVAGQPADAVLGLQVSLAGEPDYRNAMQEIRDWRGETTFRTKAGGIVACETGMTVLRDATGRPTGWLSISTDITEKKALEERFLRAQRMEGLGMLSAGIAHDLNNVLAPIGMAAGLLEQRLTGPSDLKMLQMLSRSVDRGASLVRQILDFARGAGGEHRPFDVKHIVRDVTNMIGLTFPKSIQLEDDVRRDLWPVRGNPSQIHQVVLNLCVNARDAMPDGGTLRVGVTNCELDVMQAAAIEGARPGQWLRIEVTDTGTGMPPEVFARIWDPFFTTKAKDRGTGLGLSTVRGIVETHRGFIALRSEVGRGTTFEVYLPADQTGTADGSRPPS